MYVLLRTAVVSAYDIMVEVVCSLFQKGGDWSSLESDPLINPASDTALIICLQLIGIHLPHKQAETKTGVPERA